VPSCRYQFAGFEYASPPVTTRSATSPCTCRGWSTNVTLDPAVVRPTSPSQVSALSYHPGTGRQGRRCEAPARLVTLWPARPSPHQPASASHSRLTRSPDCRFRRGQSHPAFDVRPCGAAGAPPGINHQGEAQTTSPEPASPVPRHRAGALVRPDLLRRVAHRGASPSAWLLAVDPDPTSSRAT
jgi:hypothetical protein